MDEYRSGKKRVCPGLFSHSDQQDAAQTLNCLNTASTAGGAGGRIADELSASSSKFRTNSFSMAGSAIWSKGISTPREVVSDQVAVRFHDFEQWRKAIVNITRQTHGNVYCDTYAKTLLDSMVLTESLSRTLDQLELETEYTTNSHLKRELSQVARLIQAREARKAERDFFFVDIGGWNWRRSTQQIPILKENFRR